MVPSPKDAKIIDNKWVFRVKLKANKSLKRYKNKVVTKGYGQIHKIDYTETFNPMVKPITIRVVLAFALSKDWVVRHLDVNNVFLNEELEEYVYMS